MLYETFNSLNLALGADYFVSRLDEELVRNLNPRFQLREYQKEALGRFDFYFNGYKDQKHPTQLLFHMATGSGKTLLMAANILQLYKLGYRNFIFFVNSTNVINKTKDNFLNAISSKYLFANNVKFGERIVQVREVENFETANSDDIHIVFSTIQGLHTRLNYPKENSLTYEDFEGKRIALISDEAHHINTLTKSKLNKGELEEKQSWEGTVEKIFNANKNNVLLEFTATIDLSNPAIKEKYEERIVFQYDLKQFRLDKYSKEIEVLETDLEPIDRALQAVIVSQYRRKIAEKHGIALKPVILFKANYVNPPAKRNQNTVVSSEFKSQFLQKLGKLKPSDFEKFKESPSLILQTAMAYFADNKIGLENLIKEIQNDFDETKCLSIDSSEEKEKSQVLVNTLEANDNGIRAVFAVDMLNEGWDVLNLFDIVRLYNTRDAKANKPGPTTMAEAQLIGRGARYYPFALDEIQDTFQRKFDDDASNELRIMEQLYYHSAHNPRYIQELKTALTKIGILPEKYVEFAFHVKDDFKDTDSWKTGLIFANERIENPREAIRGLGDAQITMDHVYELRTGETREETLLGESLNLQPQTARVRKKYRLLDLGAHVLRTAMDKTDFYRFDTLKRYFPYLESRKEFIESAKYLVDVSVDVYGREGSVGSLSQDEKLNIALAVLKKIAQESRTNTADYVGTKLFKARKLSEVFKEKIIKIAKDEERAQRSTVLNLAAKDWFAQNALFGTSEERNFVDFLDGVIEKLYEKYAEIALLRNERLLAIYDFEEGRRFEPDFVLVLKAKDGKKVTVHQVFVEPKGNQFKDTQGFFEDSKEGWKQKFLLALEADAKIDMTFENKQFQLLGLPFYNKDLQREFETAFEEKLIM